MAKNEFEIVWAEQEVLQAIDDGSHQVYEKYKDSHPLFIKVMKGGAMYALEMRKALERNYPNFIQAQAEMVVKTYTTGHQARTPKILKSVPKILLALHKPIIQEDIIDSGLTVSAIDEHLRFRGVYNHEYNSLVTRTGPDRTIEPDITHLATENQGWLIGWGMNDDDLVDHPVYGKQFPDGGRNLRDIIISPIR